MSDTQQDEPSSPWQGPRWVAIQEDVGPAEYSWWALADMRHTGIRAKVLGETLAQQIVDGLNAAEETA